jgi:hypothetical protein
MTNPPVIHRRCSQAARISKVERVSNGAGWLWDVNMVNLLWLLMLLWLEMAVNDSMLRLAASQPI